LKGDTGNGVDALRSHPKVRSVTPQKRVERFLKSVEGKFYDSLANQILWFRSLKQSFMVAIAAHSVSKTKRQTSLPCFAYMTAKSNVFCVSLSWFVS